MVTFSILCRIASSATLVPSPNTRRSCFFQYPLPDRFLCHYTARLKRLRFAGTFSILCRIASSATYFGSREMIISVMLSVSSAGSIPLPPYSSPPQTPLEGLSVSSAGSKSLPLLILRIQTVAGSRLSVSSAGSKSLPHPCKRLAIWELRGLSVSSAGSKSLPLTSCSPYSSTIWGNFQYPLPDRSLCHPKLTIGGILEKIFQYPLPDRSLCH